MVASPSTNGGHLGLVLTAERWEGLVQVGGDGGDCDLFGGQVNLISGLEYLFVVGTGEIHITYMCPYVYRQLHGPDCIGRRSTATPTQLGRLFTHIIDNQVPQLERQSRHLPVQGINYPYQLV